MDADLIKSILTVIAAALPLIILLLSFYLRRAEKATEPIDSPGLKVFALIRHPVDKKAWRRVKLSDIFTRILVFLLFSFYFSPFLFFSYFLNTTIFALFILIYVITSLVILSYVFVTSPIIMYSNAEESRYNLFKDVDIVIEADYHYLFNKCHDALREMKLNVIEVNEGLGALEAHKSFTGRNSEKVKVNVQVEKVPNSMNSYIVKVNFKRGFKKDYIVLPRNSKDTNLFINHLIRRPKYTHDK